MMHNAHFFLVAMLCGFIHLCRCGKATEHVSAAREPNEMRN